MFGKIIIAVNLLLFFIVYVTSLPTYDTTYILSYIKNRGYPVEVHTVVTKDGYILNLHRIPKGVASNDTRNGVVLFAHGLLETSEHWIINDNRSLPLLLWNLGYDVWLTNARGCAHSQYHVKYKTNNWRYWDFSWHEIGIYDLPVTIDYILESTGVSKISYVGHSQGVTSYLVLTTRIPEYNDKINVMVALAPAVYMSHVRNPIFQTLSRIWEMIYPNKGLFDNGFLNVALENFCKNRLVMQSLCTNLLFLMGGYDYDQLDDAVMFEVSRSMPSGASTKQLVHYLQLVRSGYFREYDYLSAENFRKYGRSTPPSYNLSTVTGNIALYYAKNDWLSVPQDVHRLRGELTNADVVVDNLIDFERFNHFDFLFARDVVPLLYEHVIETINKYN